LRQTLYAAENEKSGLGVFATFLFTHNAQIAIFAFALGFAFCLPSSLLLAYNGCAVGAMFAVFTARGLGLELAIILAGAAGLRIGWSIAFPGVLSRMAAAETAGRQGAVVMIGVVVMLFIAGLLEGFARQLVTSDTLRWTIAFATAAAWASYFYRGDRNGIAGPG
jgi:uncharacterized membrane protein SpoIIM required for sporulation